jgi:hypothetical protein
VKTVSATIASAGDAALQVEAARHGMAMSIVHGVAHGSQQAMGVLIDREGMRKLRDVLNKALGE